MAIERRALGKWWDGTEIGLDDSTMAGRFTQEELEAAFARVKPATHWKDRIDATIEEDDAVEIEKILAAIEHFTGTEGMVRDLGGAWSRITAPGYWAGPCN